MKLSNEIFKNPLNILNGIATLIFFLFVYLEWNNFQSPVTIHYFYSYSSFHLIWSLFFTFILELLAFINFGIIFQIFVVINMLLSSNIRYMLYRRLIMMENTKILIYSIGSIISHLTVIFLSISLIVYNCTNDKLKYKLNDKRNMRQTISSLNILALEFLLFYCIQVVRIDGEMKYLTLKDQEMQLFLILVVYILIESFTILFKNIIHDIELFKYNFIFIFIFYSTLVCRNILGKILSPEMYFKINSTHIINDLLFCISILVMLSQIIMKFLSVKDNDFGNDEYSNKVSSTNSVVPQSNTYSNVKIDVPLAHVHSQLYFSSEKVNEQKPELVSTRNNQSDAIRPVIDSSIREVKLITHSKPAEEIPIVDRSKKPNQLVYINSSCSINAPDISPMIRSIPEPYMVGLENDSSICYINSILQSLFSIKSFCSIIQEAHNIINRNACKDTTKPSILSVLYALMTEIISGKYTYLYMKSITDTIFVRVTHLRQGFQEDAHEFLIAFLQMIEEDIKLEVQSDIKPILTQFNDLFYGFLKSRICCRTCGYNTSSSEAFNCLSLSLHFENGKETRNLNVEACLKKYFTLELLPLTYGWKCDKCKMVREAIKEQLVEKLPKLLILHLLRNTSDGSKINSLVSYPIGKLKYNFPFSLEIQKSLPTSYEYILYAVVHHHGDTIRSGHYTATCKRPLKEKHNMQWLKFDDRRVDKISNGDEDIIKYTGYLLFYSN